jgi:hypothetical protein
MKRTIDPARFPFSAIATATVPVIATELPPEHRIAVYQIMDVINRHATTIHHARTLLEYAHVTIDSAIDHRERIRAALEN